MRPVLALGVFLTAAGVACDTGPRSGRGLRLPDGDVAAGERLFVDLGCVVCHDIAGRESREPSEGPPKVTLGGEVTRVASYGELVTAIIHPTYELSEGYPEEQLTEDGESAMVDFNDVMTVRELVDLVAFLQGTYVRRPEPRYIP